MRLGRRTNSRLNVNEKRWPFNLIYNSTSVSLKALFCIVSMARNRHLRQTRNVQNVMHEITAVVQTY